MFHTLVCAQTCVVRVCMCVRLFVWSAHTHVLLFL